MREKGGERKREFWREGVRGGRVDGGRVDDGWTVVNRRHRREKGDTTSFFFSHFPADHGEERMWSIFSRWGKVCEVHIPQKKTKSGHRFGFVRFRDVDDPRSLERRLDQIFIGAEKLFVNIPRFGMNGRSGSPERSNERNPQGDQRRAPAPKVNRPSKDKGSTSFRRTQDGAGNLCKIKL